MPGRASRLPSTGFGSKVTDGPVVSTVVVSDAGVGSSTPPFDARTLNVRAPSASGADGVKLPLSHADHEPASMRHSKPAPVTGEENVHVGVASLSRAAGSVSML